MLSTTRATTIGMVQYMVRFSLEGLPHIRYLLGCCTIGFPFADSDVPHYWVSWLSAVPSARSSQTVSSPPTLMDWNTPESGFGSVPLCFRPSNDGAISTQPTGVPSTRADRIDVIRSELWIRPKLRQIPHGLMPSKPGQTRSSSVASAQAPIHRKDECRGVLKG